jgi:hypothetical protein
VAFFIVDIKSSNINTLRINPMDEQLTKLIAGFTSEGTPLAATIGSKMEWGVVVLTAAMLANENLAASMDAEEMVDASINYYNIIQERLGYYLSQQTHSLEKRL